MRIRHNWIEDSGPFGLVILYVVLCVFFRGGRYSGQFVDATS